jgi:hypothetical protein
MWIRSGVKLFDAMQIISQTPLLNYPRLVDTIDRDLLKSDFSTGWRDSKILPMLSPG